jgi:Ni/Fe-hydrogenase subunit HybB-like protein
MIGRLNALKTILWAGVGMLFVVSIARFSQGLGATTNLSDASPWGLWIAFDVMAGVALAAGGFVLAATVYIFGLVKYRPFVRPAILTAFLGYCAVAVGLLYDLGLPWNIWHPMIFPQHHSVLFEVAMCVMLYLTVLALEFAPVALEHPLFGHSFFQRILTMLKKVTIVLVIAGIVLSTLHQSSLGSLFLIAPHRVHELWYSPIIYVLFFVSAIGLGLMTVIAESLLSAYFLGHKVNRRLLSGLGAAAAVVLTLYAALRLGDLAARGHLSRLVDGSWQGWWFLLEIGLSAVGPAILLSMPRVRNSLGNLAACAAMAIVGMVLYRFDVCIIAFERPEGLGYFPSWIEFTVSAGIVCGAGLVFIFSVENLNVYDDTDHGADSAPATPSYDPATLHSLTPTRLANPRRLSLAFVTAAAATFALLPDEAHFGAEPEQTPVKAPRTVEGSVFQRMDGAGNHFVLTGHSLGPAPRKERVELLMVDGNRDGRFVLFPHQRHISNFGDDDSCAVCHHQNMPFDRNTSCHECHRDMYEQNDIFDHASHVEALNDNEGCYECHADRSRAKTRQTATACGECHADMIVAKSRVPSPADGTCGLAPGYMDVLHSLCIGCHEEKYGEPGAEFGEAFARCDGCHGIMDESDLRISGPYQVDAPASDSLRAGGRVVSTSAVARSSGSGR